MSGDQKPYISLSEASKLTGYSTESLRQFCVKGRILGQKIGKTWVIPAEELLKLDPTVNIEKTANINQKLISHPELDSGSSPSVLDSGSMSGMTNIPPRKSFLAVPLRQLALIIGLMAVLSVPVWDNLFNLQDQMGQLKTQFESVVVANRSVKIEQPDEGYFKNLIKTTVNGMLDSFRNKDISFKPGSSSASDYPASINHPALDAGSSPSQSGVVLGTTTDGDLIASIKSVLSDSSIQDQIRGPQGPAGPTSQYIPNSGSVFGVTAPAAEHPGTIGSTTYGSSDSFATRLVTVSSDINQTGGTANLQNTTITNLTVSGSASFSGGLNLNLLPSTDDTYDIGSTDLRFKSLRIGTGDSSFAGNVGIGTTNPDDVLKIVGAGGGGVSINQTSGSAQLTLVSAGGTGIIAERTDNLLVFRNAPSGSPHVTIDSSGNVGIGITNPSEKLMVQTSSALNIARFKTTSGSGGEFLVGAQDVPGTGSVFLESNGAVTSGLSFRTRNGSGIGDRMVIDKDGNVGIGTTVPSAPLTVVSSATRPQVKISYDGTTGLFLTDSTNSAWKSWQIGTSVDAGSDLAFIPSTNTSGTPIFGATTVTFAGGGNVGIGTTDPTSKMTVVGDIRIQSGSGGQIIFADGSTMASSGLGSAAALSNTTDAIITGDSDANASGAVILKTGSNDRLHILNNGNVGIGTTNPGGKLDIYSSIGRYSSFSSIGALAIKVNDNSAINNLTLENTFGTAANYGTAILFNLGYGGDVAVAGTTVAGGRIILAQEQAWTATASTQDSYLSFQTALDGALGDKVRITSAGYVGIGTTNPGAYKLNVAGFANFGVGSPTGGTSAFDVLVNSGTVGFQVYDDNDLATPKFRIMRAGNVGIGTTNPDSKLTLSSAGSTTLHIMTTADTFNPNIHFEGFNRHWYFGALDTGSDADMALSANSDLSSANVTFKAGGNVGIGTTSPGAKLEISHYDYNPEGFPANHIPYLNLKNVNYGINLTTDMNAYFNSDATTSVKAGFIRFDTEQIWTTTATTQDSSLRFGTTLNGTSGEKVRITSDGNVGIGITNPQYKLALGSSGDKIGYYSDVSHNASIEFYNGSTANMNFQTTNATGGSFTFSGGNVGIGNAAPNFNLQVGGLPIATAQLWGAGSWSQSGLIAWSAGAVNDGNSGSTGFHTDSSAAGSYARLDAGSAKPFTGVAIFAGRSVQTNVSEWEIQWSDNDSSWTSTGQMIDLRNTYGGWTEVRWAIQGIDVAHRYWRLYKINGAGGGDYVYEVQFFQGTGHRELNIDYAGNVGIGTMSPVYKLDVAGGISINAKSLIGAGGYFVSGGSGFRWNDSTDTYNNVIMYENGNMSVRGNCSDAAGGGGCTADYAEVYKAENKPDLQSGDVLAFNTRGNIVKADGANSPAGIYSATPGLLIGQKKGINIGSGSGTEASLENNEVPVALVGRVETKVSEENGQIHAGDRLTISKTLPGYAAKMIESGQSVGIALEDSNGGAEGLDTILVFVNIGYQHIDVAQNSEGQLVTLAGDLNVNGFSLNNVKAIASQSGKWSMDENGNLLVLGHMTAGEDTAGTATIPAGQSLVAVVFNTNYDNVPKVTVTPQSDAGSFWVGEKTVSGFNIHLSVPASANIDFDWHALGTVTVQAPAPVIPTSVPDATTPDPSTPPPPSDPAITPTETDTATTDSTVDTPPPTDTIAPTP